MRVPTYPLQRNAAARLQLTADFPVPKNGEMPPPAAGLAPLRHRISDCRRDSLLRECRGFPGWRLLRLDAFTSNGADLVNTAEDYSRNVVHGGTQGKTRKLPNGDLPCHHVPR